MVVVIGIAFKDESIKIFFALLSVIFLNTLAVCLSRPYSWRHFVIPSLMLCILAVNLLVGLTLFRKDEAEK